MLSAEGWGINVPLQKTWPWLNAKFLPSFLPIFGQFNLKPRTDEQFLLDKFLVKIIFSCARQTIFVINFSVTSFITSLHVADTSKYFMYIYYIGLKTNESLILCTASSNQSISLSIFPGWPYTRTVFLVGHSISSGPEAWTSPLQKISKSIYVLGLVV
jgi:hypothetical protein